MVPFFRKIRKKLADDNQLLKYSRYAFGEILLVVIGILIALQVNDWNESKKKKKELIEKLQKVEKELVQNINASVKNIEYCRQKDSLLREVIDKRVDRESYEDNPELFRMITMIQSFDVIDDAYDNFISNLDQIPEELDSLKVLLDKSYQKDLRSVQSSQKMVEESSIAYIEHLRDEKQWYIDIKTGNYTDEIYDYYLNDKHYLNYAYYYYRMFGRNFTGRLQKFRVSSLSAYRLLHSFLNTEVKDRSEQLQFTHNPDDFNNYIGSYINGKDTISIQKENNKLKLSFQGASGSNEETEIIPYNSKLFYVEDSYGFAYIKLDKKTKTTKLLYAGSEVEYEEFDKVN